jgi:hypothetical protein
MCVGSLDVQAVSSLTTASSGMYTAAVQAQTMHQ